MGTTSGSLMPHQHYLQNFQLLVFKAMLTLVGIALFPKSEKNFLASAQIYLFGRTNCKVERLQRVDSAQSKFVKAAVQDDPGADDR